MNLIKRIQAINLQRISDPLNDFADVFTGLGCISNVVHHININPDIQPVMRTIEEIAARIPNAKIFSVLDASSGFWQIQLDHESAKLCTFNTPFGRYMFKRLPFGISSAQDVFQRVMSEIFQDIEGVEVLVDDILIWTESEEQHDKILKEVLTRSRKHNLKLNIDKSQIKCSEVRYTGHLLNHSGLKPDPKKVKAITEISEPQNKEELQRFLGMVTYLAKFIPNYSQVAAPLRLLLEKDIEWNWNHEHIESFKSLKTIITNAPVLKYFDPQKELTLSVDASSKRNRSSHTSGESASCICF